MPLEAKTIEEIKLKLSGLGHIKYRVRDTKTLHDYLIVGTSHRNECFGVNLDQNHGQMLPIKYPYFCLLSDVNEIVQFKNQTYEEVLAMFLSLYRS